MNMREREKMRVHVRESESNDLERIKGERRHKERGAREKMTVKVCV